MTPPEVDPFRCRRRDLPYVHPPLEVARRHRHSVLYRDDERSTFSPMCLSVRQRPKRSAPTDAAMIRDGRVQVARSTRVREGETAHSGKARDQRRDKVIGTRTGSDL